MSNQIANEFSTRLFSNELQLMYIAHTSDDLASSDFEFEGLSAVARRIKLLAVGERAGVVNLDRLTLLGESGAVPIFDEFDLDSMIYTQSST